jgi:hypothetical protein
VVTFVRVSARCRRTADRAGKFAASAILADRSDDVCALSNSRPMKLHPIPSLFVASKLRAKKRLDRCHPPTGTGAANTSVRSSFDASILNQSSAPMHKKAAMGTKGAL